MNEMNEMWHYTQKNGINDGFGWLASGGYMGQDKTNYYLFLWLRK
jgi:hypothetical protein